ncbi:MAG TPA: hypothetical protein PKZ07_14640 [Sedimentisphaerales bacterium]|mgnify:CR=1 FL=1|nr:hypothetical protein [Sedimentisphaerales bacterium]
MDPWQEIMRDLTNDSEPYSGILTQAPAVKNTGIVAGPLPPTNSIKWPGKASGDKTVVVVVVAVAVAAAATAVYFLNR